MNLAPAVVANTDPDWFSHFRPSVGETHVDEVNFWRPGNAATFRALPLGGPFFFRLKRPHHAVAGFGFFAGDHSLPASLAWAIFGDKNGVASAAELEDRRLAYLRRWRSDQDAPVNEFRCLILRDAVFLPESAWIPWREPEGWSDRVVAYKAYDLSIGPGLPLASLLQGRHPQRVPDFEAEFRPLLVDERHIAEQSAVVREGQGVFRLRLLDAYSRRCAVTGEKAVPALDAAHIQPYLGPVSNNVQNGLLLRADLHRLYDAGYLTVTPDLRLEVSLRLRAEFNNGDPYYPLAGRRIDVPQDERLRPSKEALKWHADHVFR